MVFTVRDGRIARFREWTDSAQLVRAYGTGVMA
jgi:ketosteroid isomerase-like protein